MKTCNWCWRRIWFWQPKTTDHFFHVHCYRVKKELSNIAEYNVLVKRYFDYTANPLKNTTEGRITYKELKQMEQRIKELEKLLYAY